MAVPSSLCELDAKASGNLVSFGVFSFEVFRFLEDWHILSMVMLLESDWRVLGSRSLKVGPLA